MLAILNYFRQFIPMFSTEQPSSSTKKFKVNYTSMEGKYVFEYNTGEEAYAKVSEINNSHDFCKFQRYDHEDGTFDIDVTTHIASMTIIFE